ncbi:2'-5' RNA ligase family protein [Nocardia sp. NPDC056000]|uniref:2'-5' RNA ligase family protein n=1 Tax=Nocardia sp. NPDC056000 TaxID=3345674 RepID=UPI0035DBF992
MQTSHDSEPLNDPAKSGPFPASMPGSITSHESIRENDWDAFRGIDYMENHWTRSVWSADQETYFWYLTFDDQALSQMTERCQRELGVVELDFVPIDGLHITLLKIGNRDQIAEGDISAIADCAQKGLGKVEPFELTVGPLAGSHGAIRFSVSPWSEILAIHETVRAATLSVLPHLKTAETQNLRPHLGIGYSNRRQRAEPLISKVSQIRDISPVTVRVDTAKLVRLRRESSAYRWHDVAALELGSNVE